MKEFKRKTRHLSTVTKQRITNSLKGWSKTPVERQAISQGLKNYWSNPANFDDPEDYDDKEKF